MYFLPHNQLKKFTIQSVFPNKLLVISKGMWAIKLLLQQYPSFLTGGASAVTKVQLFIPPH